SALFLSTATATSPSYTLSLHDALPIYPFSAHADLIAEVPFELAGLCAAASAGAGGSAATSTGQGHDSVIALAKHASRAGKFLERSEEHTSELQSLAYLVCRLLLEKKNK